MPTAHGLLAAAIETGDHGYDGRDEALTRSMHSLLLLSRYAGTAEAGSATSPVRPAEAARRSRPRAVTRVYAETSTRIRRGRRPVRQLAGLRREPDPNRVVRIGSAVQYLDQIGAVRADLWRVVKQGRPGVAPIRRQITALAMLGRELFHAGQWDAVAEIADEGDRLCTESGFPFPRWIFRSQRA